ncbi:hypothetical protein [Flavobacterium sp. WC2509]|uniref:hypothetical protein n=1 Tax=Flavobacterium sp. WC2509 TaxID=3461406 RepID=UPI004043BD0A
MKGYDVCIIDNGNYQLAMITLKGWKSIKAIDVKDINPVSKNNTVINVDDFVIPNQSQDSFYATLMLWKK